MIHLEHMMLKTPLESVGVLLGLVKQALCAGCADVVGAVPPVDDVYLMLITSPLDLTCGVEFADLTFATDTEVTAANRLQNDSAAPTYCSAKVEGPAQDLDGNWRLLFDQEIWLFDTDPQSYFGLALVVVEADEDPVTDGRLLAIASFAEGTVSLQATGDAIKLTAELRLDCNIVAP